MTKSESDEALVERIEGQARQRSQAIRQRGANRWRQVARVGTLGWMIVLPIVGGVLVGHLLDVRYDTGVRWALALMMCGVLIGGHSLWRTMQDGIDDESEPS